MDKPRKRPVQEEEEERVIPVVAEELVTGTRDVKTGAIRVHKKVHEHDETVDASLRSQTVDVRRVTVNRVVEQMPEVRHVGDEIIVPIVEEELVVSKRLILKEEIHLVQRRARKDVSEKVTLRREEAMIERVDADDKSVPVQAHRPLLGESSERPARRKTILGDD